MDCGALCGWKAPSPLEGAPVHLSMAFVRLCNMRVQQTPVDVGRFAEPHRKRSMGRNDLIDLFICTKEEFIAIFVCTGQQDAERIFVAHASAITKISSKCWPDLHHTLRNEANWSDWRKKKRRAAPRTVEIIQNNNNKAVLLWKQIAFYTILIHDEEDGWFRPFRQWFDRVWLISFRSETHYCQKTVQCSLNSSFMALETNLRHWGTLQNIKQMSP